MSPTVNPAARGNNPKPVAQRPAAQKPPKKNRIPNPIKAPKMSRKNPSQTGKKVNIIA